MRIKSSKNQSKVRSIMAAILMAFGLSTISIILSGFIAELCMRIFYGPLQAFQKPPLSISLTVLILWVALYVGGGVWIHKNLLRSKAGRITYWIVFTLLLLGVSLGIMVPMFL